MAAADKNASKSKADKADKPKGGKSLLTIGLVAVIAAGAAGGGAWYFASHGSKDEKADAPKAKSPGEVPAPAQYFALEPPFVVNLTGPARLSVREVALELGRLVGREPRFEGREADDALLSDTHRLQERFGVPAVSEHTLIAWVAEWVQRGGRTLGKATRFERRDGGF